MPLLDPLDLCLPPDAVVGSVCHTDIAAGRQQSTGGSFHEDIRGRIDNSYSITRRPNGPPGSEHLCFGQPPVEGFNTSAQDPTGHANLVIGTAIGAGVVDGRPGGSDWFAQGQGIALQARGLSIKPRLS